jgi:hypothetical protein
MTTINQKDWDTAELKHIYVGISKPTKSKPGGVCIEGWYKVQHIDGENWIIMAKPNGQPIRLDGQKFADTFSTESGKLNEREVAALLTKDIKDELSKSLSWSKPVQGFDDELIYPPSGMW